MQQMESQHMTDVAEIKDIKDGHARVGYEDRNGPYAYFVYVNGVQVYEEDEKYCDEFVVGWNACLAHLHETGSVQ